MAKVKYKNGNQTITLNNVKPDLLDFNDYVYISVTIGVFSSTDYPSINGKQSGYIPKGTKIRVTAPETILNTSSNTNRYFYYMRTTQGEIFSYERIIDMYAYADTSLECIYGTEEEIEKQPVILFMGKGIKLSLEENKIGLNYCSNITDDYNKINWGILLSSKADNESLQEEDMIVTNSYITKCEMPNGNTTRYYSVNYYLTNATIFNNCRLLKARAYCTIEKDGVQSVIYSRMITMQILK